MMKYETSDTILRKLIHKIMDKKILVILLFIQHGNSCISSFVEIITAKQNILENRIKDCFLLFKVK